MLAGSLGLRVCQTWVWVHQFEGLVEGNTVGMESQKGVGAACVTGLKAMAAVGKSRSFPSQTVLGVSQTSTYLLWTSYLVSECVFFIKYMTQIGIVVLHKIPGDRTAGMEKQG